MKIGTIYFGEEEILEALLCRLLRGKIYLTPTLSVECVITIFVEIIFDYKPNCHLKRSSK